MAPVNQYANVSSRAERGIDWAMITLIFGGILFIITLITIFFVIPHYAEQYIAQKVQESLGNLTG